MAGNYVEFTSKVKHRNVTFSIYCRESLKEYMENLKEFVLEVTKKSMQFYEEFFGVEY
jgi:aminopeptidase N